ncbi:MAG: adenylosuccinate lyase, partial [Acidobacteria bacterium]|nr:adenylosuccinate lyase [Acidobacteriota bacterium]MDW7984140.1 adenylosuccinate lyase [Acidobacteriota bacterium]
MIPRYTLPEMARWWSDEFRLQCWLDVELAVLEAFVRLGWLTSEEFESIRSKIRVSAEEVQAREALTQHDVVAFVESASAPLGPLG